MRMLVCLLVVAMSGKLCCGEVDVRGMGALDKRILIACATDPNGSSYKLLHRLFVVDTEAKPVADAIDANLVDAAIQARMYGIAQFCVGGLHTKGAATATQLRGWSAAIIARMDRQSSYMGKAKPALTWLNLEDDKKYTPADLPLLAPYMAHPLVAATIIKDVDPATLGALVRSPQYQAIAIEGKVFFLEAAVNAKAIDHRSPEVQAILPELGKASPLGAVLRYRLATIRDEALAADYGASLEAAFKAKDRFTMMQLEIAGMDLVPLLNLQGLNLDDATKSRLLKQSAGGKYVPPERKEP